MKTKFNVKRKGFTLVELLIVIVVIGILSAMMMLSSTEAVSSARANNIVSNLRNLKTAALSLYVASIDKIRTNASTGEIPNINHVKRYLNNEGITSDYNIAFRFTTNNDYDTASWYITCKVTESNVKAKLAAKASGVGILQGKNSGTTVPDDDTTNYTNADYVCIKVR